MNRPRQLVFCDHILVTPDRDAGSLRTFNLLRILVEHFTITYLYRRPVPDADIYRAQLESSGIRVVHDRTDQGIKPLTELFMDRPAPDVAIFARPEGAAIFMPRVIAEFIPRPTLIYDSVDLHFERFRSLQTACLNDRRDRWKEWAAHFRRQEISYLGMETFAMRQADETWLISADEQKIVTDRGMTAHGITRVVPLIQDPDPINQPFGLRRDLLFLGSFDHLPNLDAVRFHATRILPEFLLRGMPTRLRVFGAQCENIREWGNASITIEGHAPDPRTPCGECLAAFIPLVSGAGMKGKIAMSMAFGLPVITTPFGAQGYKKAGDYMLIGSTPAELVDHVARLQSDPLLWQNLRDAGLAYIRDTLSRAAIASLLEDILRSPITAMPRGHC